MPRKLRLNDGLPAVPAARPYSRTLRARGSGLPRAQSPERIQGQTMLEYLLVMVAILFALLYAVRAGGPIQSAAEKVMSDSGSTMSSAVNAARARMGF